MLKRNNSVLIFFVFILFLSGCGISNIPASYRFLPRDVTKEITGHWIEIKTPSDQIENREIKLSGEKK